MAMLNNQRVIDFINQKNNILKLLMSFCSALVNLPFGESIDVCVLLLIALKQIPSYSQ